MDYFWSYVSRGFFELCEQYKGLLLRHRAYKSYLAIVGYGESSLGRNSCINIRKNAHIPDAHYSTKKCTMILNLYFNLSFIKIFDFRLLIYNGFLNFDL